MLHLHDAWPGSLYTTTKSLRRDQPTLNCIAQISRTASPLPLIMLPAAGLSKWELANLCSSNEGDLWVLLVGLAAPCWSGSPAAAEATVQSLGVQERKPG